MATVQNAQTKNGKARESKFFLGKLFTSAVVRSEPEEPQKIVVAGLAEARVQKDYPETFFGRASAVMRGEIALLFKISLWFLAFTLPIILVFAVGARFFEASVLDGAYNFMGNVGVGYPGGGDSIANSLARLYWEVKEPVFGMMAAAAVIALIGLPGQLYAAKRSYFQNYYKKVTSTFFMGVAKYWWQFLLVGVIGIAVAFGMGTSIFYLLAQQAVGTAGAGAYCAVVFSFLVGAPVLLFGAVLLPLSMSYQLSFKQAFKNVFVIIANNPVTCILAGVLSAVPLIIFGMGTIAGILVYIVMAAVGCSFAALMWIALVNRGMVKCTALYNANLRKQVYTEKQMQKQQVKTAAVAAPVKKKPQQKPYQNPKKKKK
jgi:hypothetical protein